MGFVHQREDIIDGIKPDMKPLKEPGFVETGLGANLAFEANRLAIDLEVTPEAVNCGGAGNFLARFGECGFYDLGPRI